MATFVLIPGAGGDPGYWYRVTPLLAAAGHAAVAVDLPNHEGVTLSDQVDAVVAAVSGALPPVVVVAQSMGAQLAPAVCDRVPVALLVYVNAMIPSPGETAGSWWPAVGQDEAQRAAAVQDGRDPDAAFDPMAIFFHDVPAAVVYDVFAAEERSPAGSLFTAAQPMRSHPAVPTRVLAGRDDRFFPVALQRRISRERLGVEAEVVPGGHLLALSRPDVLTARLLGLLDELSPAAADGES
jgi:pimeloyl-ACP methyl ester carboxylesterase